MEKPQATPAHMPAATQAHATTQIARAVEAVEGLATDVMSEHVEAFEHAHRVLQEHLHGAVDG